jgi:hypothetical protein
VTVRDGALMPDAAYPVSLDADAAAFAGFAADPRTV